MTSLDVDLDPFGAAPTSPNAFGPSTPRLATDTDDTEKQISAQVETALSEIASLLGTNRYYRRESRTDSAYTGSAPRASLPFTSDADAARTFALVNGLPMAEADSTSGPAPAPVRSVSFQEDVTASQGRALCLQLEQARDLMRRLDSERRFYRQRALRQQKELDQVSSEKLAMSVRASEGHRQSLGTENLLSAARAQLRGQESELDRQAEELLALRRFLRALPPVYAQAYDVHREDGAAVAAPLIDALHLVPDRRFEEAFRDKMDVIGFKRRCSRARGACEATSARYEALCMACEDVDVGSTRAEVASACAAAAGMGAGGAGLSETAAEAAALLSVPAPSSYAMPTVAALLQQRRRSSVLDFPVHVPFSPATPQDAELKSLIFRSAYAEPLMEARDGLLRLSTRLKTAEENGLQNLYGLLGDALRRLPASERPPLQKAFEKQMDALQRAQRELLFQLVAHVNTATVGITAVEKRLAQSSQAGGSGGSGARRTGHDVACMASDTSVESYRVHQIESQLRQKELRLLEERGVAEKKVVTLNDALHQQQAQTLTILESLEDLERTVAASTRLALRHHHASTEAIDKVLKEPFRATVSPQPLRAQDLGDVRLVAKVAESVDVTVGCLRQLTGLSAPATPAADGEAGSAATTPTGGAKKAKKKRLSLTSRRPSEALGLPSAARTRSRSHPRRTGARLSPSRRATAQEDVLAATLPDFAAQLRRHTLPAVPTTSCLSARSAASTGTTGQHTSGRGSVVCIPTPPTTALAAKMDGQAPRRGSTLTTPMLDDQAALAETSLLLLSQPLTPHAAACASAPLAALTPVSVNQAGSRRSSSGAAAPAVMHTAKRKTAEEGPEEGRSPPVMAPEVKACLFGPDGAEPHARSVTREPTAKSREASLAPVSIVNIELFRGGGPSAKE